MRVCIHRGTREIGGNCVEIEAQGKRIVLDVGVPLDMENADEFTLHPNATSHHSILRHTDQIIDHFFGVLKTSKRPRYATRSTDLDSKLET